MSPFTIFILNFVIEATMHPWGLTVVSRFGVLETTRSTRDLRRFYAIGQNTFI